MSLFTYSINLWPAHPCTTISFQQVLTISNKPLTCSHASSSQRRIGSEFPCTRIGQWFEIGFGTARTDAWGKQSAHLLSTCNLFDLNVDGDIWLLDQVMTCDMSAIKSDEGWKSMSQRRPSQRGQTLKGKYPHNKFSYSSNGCLLAYNASNI